MTEKAIMEKVQALAKIMVYNVKQLKKYNEESSFHTIDEFSNVPSIKRTCTNDSMSELKISAATKEELDLYRGLVFYLLRKTD